MIPLRILYGEEISDQYLRENSMEHYEGLIKSIRLGDIRLYQAEILKNEKIFLEQLTFLFVEKLR